MMKHSSWKVAEVQPRDPAVPSEEDAARARSSSPPLKEKSGQGQHALSLKQLRVIASTRPKDKAAASEPVTKEQGAQASTNKDHNSDDSGSDVDEQSPSVTIMDGPEGYLEAMSHGRSPASVTQPKGNGTGSAPVARSDVRQMSEDRGSHGQKDGSSRFAWKLVEDLRRQVQDLESSMAAAERQVKRQDADLQEAYHQRSEAEIRAMNAEATRDQLEDMVAKLREGLAALGVGGPEVSSAEKEQRKVEMARMLQMFDNVSLRRRGAHVAADLAGENLARKPAKASVTHHRGASWSKLGENEDGVLPGAQGEDDVKETVVVVDFEGTRQGHSRLGEGAMGGVNQGDKSQLIKENEGLRALLEKKESELEDLRVSQKKSLNEDREMALMRELKNERESTRRAEEEVFRVRTESAALRKMADDARAATEKLRTAWVCEKEETMVRTWELEAEVAKLTETLQVAKAEKAEQKACIMRFSQEVAALEEAKQTLEMEANKVRQAKVLEEAARGREMKEKEEEIARLRCQVQKLSEAVAGGMEGESMGELGSLIRNATEFAGRLAVAEVTSAEASREAARCKARAAEAEQRVSELVQKLLRAERRGVEAEMRLAEAEKRKAEVETYMERMREALSDKNVKVVEQMQRIGNLERQVEGMKSGRERDRYLRTAEERFSHLSKDEIMCLLVAEEGRRIGAEQNAKDLGEEIEQVKRERGVLAERVMDQNQSLAELEAMARNLTQNLGDGSGKAAGSDHAPRQDVVDARSGAGGRSSAGGDVGRMVMGRGVVGGRYNGGKEVDRLAEATAKLNASQARASAFEKRAELAEDGVKELEEQLARVKMEVEGAKAAIMNLHRERRASAEKLSEAEEALASARGDAERAERWALAAEDRAEAAEKRYQQLVGDGKDVCERLLALQGQADELERQVAGYRKALAAAEDEKRVLDEQVDGLVEVAMDSERMTVGRDEQLERALAELSWLSGVLREAGVRVHRGQGEGGKGTTVTLVDQWRRGSKMWPNTKRPDGSDPSHDDRELDPDADNAIGHGGAAEGNTSDVEVKKQVRLFQDEITSQLQEVGKELRTAIAEMQGANSMIINHISHEDPFVPPSRSVEFKDGDMAQQLQDISQEKAAAEEALNRMGERAAQLAEYMAVLELEKEGLQEKIKGKALEREGGGAPTLVHPKASSSRGPPPGPLRTVPEGEKRVQLSFTLAREGGRSSAEAALASTSVAGPSTRSSFSEHEVLSDGQPSESESGDQEEY